MRRCLTRICLSLCRFRKRNHVCVRVCQIKVVNVRNEYVYRFIYSDNR